MRGSKLNPTKPHGSQPNRLRLKRPTLLSRLQEPSFTLYSPVHTNLFLSRSIGRSDPVMIVWTQQWDSFPDRSQDSGCYTDGPPQAPSWFQEPATNS